MWAAAIAAKASRGPAPALLALAAFGWLLVLALDAGGAAPMALCGGLAVDRIAWVLGDLRLTLALHPPAVLAGSWALMLLAMTPPLLAQPVSRLWRGSLARRRGVLLAVFAAGYVAVWMIAGAVLLAAGVLMGAALGAWAFPGAVLLAAAWQILPVKRLALIRCCQSARLRVFGLAAAGDALAYGLTQGAWCALACWPLMLAPLTASTGHLPLMLLAAAIMLVERHGPHAPPRWKPQQA